MNEWQNIPDNIEDYQGFVYIIKSKDGKMGYIGQKTFWRTAKLPALKGRSAAEKKKRAKNKGTNKRHVRKETDWKDYWSSNTFLQEEVKRIGEDKFERIIIMPCESKSMMSYFELYYQMKHRVLFNDYWLNGIINVRLGGLAFKNQKEIFNKKLDEIEYHK